MTTKVKVEFVNGNKAVELVDQNGNVHATLDGPGRSVEVTMHADLQVTVRETGEFFGGQTKHHLESNAVVDEDNTDADPSVND